MPHCPQKLPVIIKKVISMITIANTAIIDIGYILLALLEKYSLKLRLLVFS